MKTPALIHLAAALLCAPLMAEPLPLTEWSSDLPRAILSDRDTAAPVLEQISSRNLGSLTSRFETISLEEGQSITATFTLTLEPDGTEATFSLFRFGLFYNPNDDAESLLGWSGFLLINPNEPMAENPLMVFRRTPQNDISFVSTSGTDLTAPLQQSTGEFQLTFPSGEPRTFRVTFRRNGTALEITGDHGTGTFSGRFEDAFVENYEHRFNRFGFYATEADTPLHTLKITGAAIIQEN